MGNAKMPETGFILGTPRRMLSHLSVPDEGFLCMKAKAKVKYLGMLEDEFSFKSGDEI